MMLGLTFGTPLLLIGLLAAAVPLVIHLMSSVKAQEVLFPTLRFLQSSMQRTARRRHLQHWLLLLMRMVLLGLLAFAVAEPISNASRGFLGGQDYAAVIVLDDSYSMEARAQGGATRFALAKAQARALLDGERRPAQAALLTTSGQYTSRSLLADPRTIRTEIDKAQIAYTRAPIAQRMREALDMLNEQKSLPQKSIYIFSDLQRASFDELLQASEIAADDTHVFIIDTAASRELDNVGIANLDVAGRQIVDQAIEFTSTLVNSSPSDKRVQVALRIGGQEVSQRATVNLMAAGKAGSSTTVKFYHIFGKAGPASGEVAILSEDDLAADNVRHFAVDIGERVKALIVRGDAGQDGWAMDSAAIVRLALDPYGVAEQPWSVVPEIIEAQRLSAASLKNAAIAFFCELPSFTASQAKAVADFTSAGGTSVFFLGPDVVGENYNKVLVDDLARQGGLLPARIGQAVGEVGPGAEAWAVEWMDLSHDYLRNLYVSMTDYLTVQAQRYYKLSRPADAASTLMRLRSGEPLMLAKPFGKGSAVLVATTASPRWANLPVGGANVFLPMLEKMSLTAGMQARPACMFLSGQSQIRILPGLPMQDSPSQRGQLAVSLSLPQQDGKGSVQNLAASYDAAEGFAATFEQAHLPGLYHWQVPSGVDMKLQRPHGVFAVNPAGAESNLEAIPAADLQAALNRRGLAQVYVATSLADAHSQAALAAKGHNWWDLLLAIVIVLLVGEALLSNRARADLEILPKHLIPKSEK